MTDALTIEALARISTALAGTQGPERSALLRQIIAMTAGQLASAEGPEHVQIVFDRVSGALSRRAA